MEYAKRNRDNDDQTTWLKVCLGNNTTNLFKWGVNACVSILQFSCFSECTCGSFRPLESESEVSLYWEDAISTSVDALLRFFRGLQASEISLAPWGRQNDQRKDGFHSTVRRRFKRSCDGKRPYLSVNRSSAWSREPSQPASWLKRGSFGHCEIHFDSASRK